MKFADDTITVVADCPVCGIPGEIIAEMPAYPITEVFKPFGSTDYSGPTQADQRLLYCEACNHLYLSHHLPRDFIYSNYVTESSSSQGAQIALDNFHAFVSRAGVGPASSIIDIGANDTSLLRRFAGGGAKLIGIDPNISSDDPGIQCVKGYVEECDLAAMAPGRRIFLCSHTIEHLYDVRAFMRQIAEVLGTDDDFFLQLPSCELLVRDVRFDQVHHQHLNYFSIRSLSRLLAECGLTVVRHHYDSDHYGALMCHVRKGAASQHAAQSIEVDSGLVRASHRAFMQSMQAAQARIGLLGNFYCFGASLMLPVLAYYLPSLANAHSILDGSSAKHGLTYINFERPIKGDGGIEYRDSDFVVTAVATKAATRRIAGTLFERGARNIVFPLNTL